MGSSHERIPFVRTDRQFAEHRKEFLGAVLPVLESGAVLQGAEVAAFEKVLAEKTNRPFVVACGSGTDAIMLSIAALGLRDGARIAVPSFSFVATVAPVLHARCVPTFVDCEKTTGMMDRRALLELIKQRKVDAIIIVHLYGQLMEAEEISEAATKENIPIIEDAAQALGACRNGQTFGQFGCISALSFDPMKVLGAWGSGGAVITRDETLAKRTRQLRLHGHDGNGHFLEAGFNSQLASLQAAVLRAKLTLVDGWQSRRAEITKIYDVACDRSGLERMQTVKGNKHNWHKYVIRSSRRAWILERLAAQGIQCKIHYEIPLHEQPLFARYTTGIRCPIASALAREVLSLPIYPELTDDEIQRVATALSRTT